MRIKEYKLDKKEDMAVFRVLMRCIKEENRLKWSYTIGPTKKGFVDIVGKCYASRRNHGTENFQTNIFYWPEDCGGLFKSKITKFLYVAMLINSLDIKIKELGVRYNELYSDICNNPKISFQLYNGEIVSFSDEIKNAFIKCGLGEKDSMSRLDTIILLCKTSKYDLPL